VLDRAWDKIVLGAERKTVLTSHDRRVVACHQGGHALVAWLTPAAHPAAFQSDEEQPFPGYQLAQGRDFRDATA
jgi:hypothetical protein